MSGVNSFIPVRVSSTADIPNETNNGYTMESTANAVLTIDGVNVIVGDWILLRYQADATENGLYRMTQLGIAGIGGQHWIIVREGQGSSLKHNMIFQVIDGILNASKQFRIEENDPITSGYTTLLPTTGIIPNAVDYTIGDLTVTGKITSLLTSGQAFELNPTGAPVTIGRPYVAGNWFDSFEFNPVVGCGQAINSSQNVKIAIDSANVGSGYEFNIVHNGYGYVSGTKLFSVADNGTIYLGAAGNPINEFSIDGTLVGNSNLALPTEQAVKTYVDGRFATGIDNHIARYDGTSNIQSSAITIADTTAIMNFLPTTGLLDIQCDSIRNIFMCTTTTTGSIRIGRGALSTLAYASDTLYNIAIGASSLFSNTGGNHNIGIGFESLYSIPSGNNNIGIGDRAGDGGAAFAISDDNTYIGYKSGSNISSGNGNVCIGNYTGRSALNTLSYSINVGYNAQVANDYYCQIGADGEASHSSKMKYRSQILCDETWRDGNTGVVTNDGTGNFVKTSYVFISGSFGASWFGAWTGDHDVTCYYQKVGNQATLFFQLANGALDVNGVLQLYTTGHVTPLAIISSLRPSLADVYIPFGYRNATTVLSEVGCALIKTDGTITLYASGGGNFTSPQDIYIALNVTYFIA
jgi:hypothetical protein